MTDGAAARLKRRGDDSIPAAKRRIRGDAEATRGRLLDATERLMVAEGYAAVTTRRVAGMVGLTPALVHYHYKTTEDLLVATYRRAISRHDQNVRHALARDRPLHALWSLVSDPGRMALGVEFMAMANHRKLIRTEICRHSEDERKLHAEALSKYLGSGQSELWGCSPDCVAMILSAITRGLVMDEILSVSYGHAETRTLIEKLLGQLEQSRRPARRAGTARRPAKRAASKR